MVAIGKGPFVGPGFGANFSHNINNLTVFLRNVGCNNRPFHLIVLGRDQESPHVEQLGSYDPFPNNRGEILVSFNFNRLFFWMGSTGTIIFENKVQHLLGISGFFPIFYDTYREAFVNREIQQSYIPTLPEDYKFKTIPTFHDKKGICGTTDAKLRNAELKKALEKYQVSDKSRSLVDTPSPDLSPSELHDKLFENVERNTTLKNHIFASSKSSSTSNHTSESSDETSDSSSSSDDESSTEK